MDWQGTSAEANKTVDIAIVKVEATVPVTDPKYGGAVVLNPGTFAVSSANLAFWMLIRSRHARVLIKLHRRTRRLRGWPSFAWRPPCPDYTVRWSLGSFGHGCEGRRSLTFILNRLN